MSLLSYKTIDKSLNRKSSAECNYSSMPLLQWRFRQTAIEFGEWVSNGISCFCTLITHYVLNPMPVLQIKEATDT